MATETNWTAKDIQIAEALGWTNITVQPHAIVGDILRGDHPGELPGTCIATYHNDLQAALKAIQVKNLRWTLEMLNRDCFSCGLKERDTDSPLMIWENDSTVEKAAARALCVFLDAQKGKR